MTFRSFACVNAFVVLLGAIPTSRAQSTDNSDLVLLNGKIMNSPISKLRCTTVQAERARELIGPSPRVGRDNSRAFQQHLLFVTAARQLGRTMSRTRNFFPENLDDGARCFSETRHLATWTPHTTQILRRVFFDGKLSVCCGRILMTTDKKRLRVGVLFGGRSGEHEVSLASAASVIRGLDPDKYEAVPIGISKEGHWLIGGAAQKMLPEVLKAGQRVVMTGMSSRTG